MEQKLPSVIVTSAPILPRRAGLHVYVPTSASSSLPSAPDRAAREYTRGRQHSPGCLEAPAFVSKRTGLIE